MQNTFRAEPRLVVFFLCFLVLGPARAARAEVVALTVGINATCPYGLMA